MWVAVKKGSEGRAWWCMPLIQQVAFCKFEASLICPVSYRTDRVIETLSLNRYINIWIGGWIGKQTGRKDKHMEGQL